MHGSHAVGAWVGGGRRMLGRIRRGSRGGRNGAVRIRAADGAGEPPGGMGWPGNGGVLTGAVREAAVVLGLMLLASGLPVIGLALVLYGAGNGIFSIAKGALPLIWFGPERYASIMGRLARPNQIAQAMAPTPGALMLSAGGVEVTLAALAVLALWQG